MQENVGIQSSSSNWISFIDADDYWMKEKLMSINKVIQNNNDVNFIAHD